MPPSPAMRYSPGREPRVDNHKRGRSLESGLILRERDDDLALFNEVQSRERDNFLLQTNDDFEDTFTTKLRHFSDYKLGINIPARGESSDLLNAEEEKNDYEWLITPPDTPLFPSLDDEPPQVNLAQRGRPRTQPISISRSSTMEKSHRSSRGSASPNRLSPSPRSGTSTFQARGRASSAPSSSPPATLRPASASRRPSPPSSKSSTPAPRASTPTPRRLSTGSTGTTGASNVRGVSPVKTSRGNSASPKIRAWQSNIPGFSAEAPPNLRTSLADRPASYVRGSSPASRNGRHSMSPIATRSISSSHSHDRDRFSSHSKGSIASSGDDDVESLPSLTVGSSERSNSRRMGGLPNNKASLTKKPSRTVSSSSAPKRSFDLALRQMDHKKGPQNMFRPLLSSVPSSTFYAGKASSAHRTMISRNSSVTTSSNASSDLGTSGAHDTEGSEVNQDDASSECVKVPDGDVEDELFMFEKADALNEDRGNEAHDVSPTGELSSRLNGYEEIGNCDSANVVLDDFIDPIDLPDSDHLKDTMLCSRCGCRYSPIRPIEEDIQLCADCLKSNSPLDIANPVTSIVVAGSSQTEATTTRSAQHEDNVKDGQSTYGEPIWNFLSETSLSRPQQEECEPRQVNHQVISTPSISYSDTGSDQNQIQHVSDFPNSKVDPLEGAGISILLKRSSSIKGPVVRSRNFSASSISYDDLSYVRDSTNSMRSSVGHGSVSASSSVDFGPARQTDSRFQRQLSSRKSETENYKYDTNAKHQRSESSLSGTSSHAYHAPSLGTSTLDSFEVAHVGRDVTETASVAPQDNTEENDTCTENEDDNNLRTAINSTSQLSAQSQIAVISEEVLLTSSLKFEEPVVDLENDIGGLQSCTTDEDVVANPCVNSVDVAEVPLEAISEGEIDHTCQSSPASQYDVSCSSKSSIEEIQDPPLPIVVDKDIAVSSNECDTSNHPSSILEESTVLVEGQGGIKGRSLTLEEATDTILFCSSIVHNLAYEAATLAIEKENPPDPVDDNSYWPLVPATGKADSGKKELHSRNTSKRSSKSQKAKQRKVVETDTTKPPNSNDTDYNTDSPKTRIIGVPNNGENMKPPKLESKCNCTIM